MFSIKDFFRKYDQIWPFLQNESLIKNFSFCAVPRKAFVIKKIRSTSSWGYVISDLNGEEIVGQK